MHPPLKARNMVDPKEMDELRKELARTAEGRALQAKERQFLQRDASEALGRCDWIDSYWIALNTPWLL